MEETGKGFFGAISKNSVITVANFILLLGLAFNTGSFTQSTIKDIELTNERLTNVEVGLYEHKKSADMHPTYEKSAVLFVPRVEIDARLKNIEENQEKIAIQQEKIYNKLIKVY